MVTSVERFYTSHSRASLSAYDVVADNRARGYVWFMVKSFVIKTNNQCYLICIRVIMFSFLMAHPNTNLCPNEPRGIFARGVNIW